MTGVDAITAEHVDEVLATTRAVRRRLDLDRPVDNQLLLDCIDLAEQAPTGGNLGSRRWIIVRDQGVKDQLGELYRKTALPFMAAAAERLAGTGHRNERVVAALVLSPCRTTRRLPSALFLGVGPAHRRRSAPDHLDRAAHIVGVRCSATAH